MNLPNKLTIIRVCLIPFFAATLLFDHGNNYTMRIVANVLFIAASLTDLFDGKIARKYNLVTAPCLGCHHHHQPRIHHQRIPSGGGGQRRGHCSQLLGQI